MDLIQARIDDSRHLGHVLAALYNASKPQGMGFLHYDPARMTPEQGLAMIEEGTTDFDYLKGRVMKIDLGGVPIFYPDGSGWIPFDPWGYDRDNGAGAALGALSAAGIEARPVPTPPKAAPAP